MTDEAEATLPAADTMRAVSVAATPTEADLGQRYDLGPILGRGGMGEVRLARDVRIDREVAVKLMHPGARDDGSIARFFREARVQGALEHPAIVPVHDLGIDGDGRPYFVMKKLAGTTLHDVLARGIATDEDIGPGRSMIGNSMWTRRLLLARLVDVCLAIELAHTRGVVHRDLKPANIQLGDFGEAYVLDWGLARIVGDTELQSVQSLSGDAVSGKVDTVAGELLGTPGYMSPEQARGEQVDAATDVFALGCILFEILTGQPALPRGIEGIERTLSTPSHRPSLRTPDLEIAPELDDLSTRATAADRALRPTAREIADAIQAYLDGDRDLARRKELAAEHAALARAALAGSMTVSAARAQAMRDAGRAIALDPDNAVAQALLANLLLVRDDEAIPEPAIAAANLERGRILQRLLRFASYGFLSMLALTPILLGFTIRAWWPLALLVIVLASITAITWYISRDVVPMRSPWFPPVLVLMFALLFCLGLIFGPLFLLPVFITGSLAAWVVVPTGYSALAIFVAHASVILVLLALETLHVLPSTFHAEGRSLVLEPWVLDMTPTMTIVTMTIALLTQSLNTLNVMLSFKHTFETAQNRRHAQAWHLQQLLPQKKD